MFFFPRRITMDSLHFVILLSYFFIFLLNYAPTVIPFTMKPSDSIMDGQTLNSQAGIFQLGFFTPSANSKKRYLGIWYKSLPTQTVVWVANRDAPIHDNSGVLKLDSFTGNLVLVANLTQDIIWSSNSSESSVEHHPVVEFLESGNLVLRHSRNDDPKSYLWQSFDHPTDTMLPGMKLGWNRKTGKRWFISSWKNVDDPSSGDFTYGYGSEHEDIPEFIVRKGPKKYYRGGTWNGLQASGSPGFQPNTKFTFEYVDNAEEVYFMYRLINQSVFVRFVLTQVSSTEGLYQLLTWVENTKSWVLQYTFPRDRCDSYELCGPYSNCDVTNMEVCQCLKGFTPVSPEDWSRFDWSLGCKRHVPVECREGEGFNRITGVKLPETTRSWLNTSINLEECKLKCLNDCTCMACANSDIREGGSGCILWFSDLIDMRQLSGVRQDLYIRMAASELDSEGNSRMKVRMILIVSIALVGGVIIFGSGSCYIWKKKRLKGATKKDDVELLLYSKRDDREIPLFDLSTITSATNNFSRENMLGEGGFGPVYKGILDGGEEIAVKRLSKDSIQGINEFKNEVKLILKLQHKNLVRILGCCVQGVEKMLVYEYMHNNSLDAFIFDKPKSRLLDWQKRFQIILGITRGLLYLHQDSRLKIIHRDLKASNVLLDSEMVAKISDFGIARIFEGDQTEARTKRVIGTRGYMSPEYAFDGHFSVKSDVYSFGVLVLEIISGVKNRGFSHPDHGLNLLGHAWRLWTEDNSVQLVDELVNSLWFVDEISRCIHIGLLCVQNDPNCRPTMLSVLFMLSSETALPAPQPPGFYIDRKVLIEENSSSRDKERCISNDATITLLEPR